MAELAHSRDTSEIPRVVTHYHHHFTFCANEENWIQSCAMSELSIIPKGEEPLVGSYELVIILICFNNDEKLGVEFP